MRGTTFQTASFSFSPDHVVTVKQSRFQPRMCWGNDQLCQGALGYQKTEEQHKDLYTGNITIFQQQKNC